MHIAASTAIIYTPPAKKSIEPEVKEGFAMGIITANQLTQNHSIPTPISELKIELLEVEEAQPSDAEKICALVNAAFEKDMFRKGPRTSVDKIKQSFDSNHTWYILKDRTIGIAGVVLFSTDQAPETKDQGNIHMLAVHESFRGKNISKLLLKKVEGRAYSDLKDKIRLIAAQVNSQLVQFYEKEGYKQTGETFTLPNWCVRQEYRNEGKDADPSKIVYVHMEKALKGG